MIAYVITAFIVTFTFLPRKTQRIIFFHDAISLFMKEEGVTALFHGVTERYVTGLQMRP